MRRTDNDTKTKPQVTAVLWASTREGDPPIRWEYSTIDIDAFEAAHITQAQDFGNVETNQSVIVKHFEDKIAKAEAWMKEADERKPGWDITINYGHAYVENPDYPPYSSWLGLQRHIADELYALKESGKPLVIDGQEYDVEIENPDSMYGAIWYTYNHENSLSQDIHGLTFHVDGDEYVIWSRHIGADARAGFDKLHVGLCGEYFAMGMRCDYSVHDKREGANPEWIEFESSSDLQDWVTEQGLSFVYQDGEPEFEYSQCEYDAWKIDIDNPDVVLHIDDRLEY